MLSCNKYYNYIIVMCTITVAITVLQFYVTTVRKGSSFGCLCKYVCLHVPHSLHTTKPILFNEVSIDL